MELKKSFTEKEKRSSQIAILTGFLIIAYFTSSWNVILIAGLLGIVFLFSETMSMWVLKGWFLLAFVLGWVNSRILLTLVFFGVLFPLAFLSRLRHKDPLRLKFPHNSKTLFTERNHTFTTSDFEKQW
ncbi:MAG: SxtJ family membrane protein [Chloroherpetonaceae bacterium]|nr:SxtJ family membrane protein [Chloroherpetonaceae bacterium]